MGLIKVPVWIFIYRMPYITCFPRKRLTGINICHGCQIQELKVAYSQKNMSHFSLKIFGYWFSKFYEEIKKTLLEYNYHSNIKYDIELRVWLWMWSSQTWCAFISGFISVWRTIFLYVTFRSKITKITSRRLFAIR